MMWTGLARKLTVAILVMMLAAAIIFYFLTMPSRLDETVLAEMTNGDAARGERIFHAGGCNSCHAAEGAAGEDKRRLGGGLALQTPFGIFYAPNISPYPENGIGGWSGADFANAMLRGISPQGTHYYPAFPYTSYARMNIADIADLWAYMQTLPLVDQANRRHELPLPFQLRRGIGLWKRIYLSAEPVIAIDESDPQLVLGRYLVEGSGHCGECHTPRNLLGGPDYSRWLAGGAAPEGDGMIPNITPHENGIGDWSAGDIAYSLESGFTPEFDSFGSSMVAVQQNMAALRPEDRAAIAAYLKIIPPVAD
jgi:mono/diheme cytochrome c family protein